jgi:hypothetical protein
MIESLLRLRWRVVRRAQPEQSSPFSAACGWLAPPTLLIQQWITECHLPLRGLVNVSADDAANAAP